jgi:2-polyprenyl-3-methyl-5-hydroxy-6-metoxy-1,4-benzoquinol methylase
MLQVEGRLNVPARETDSSAPAICSTLSAASISSIANAQACAVPARAVPSYSIEDQRRMSEARNYFAWQARIVKREIAQRVVEVGCGIGNFTGTLLDREAVCAVDAEAACVERLLARYPGRQNLSAFACDVQSEEFSRLTAFGADSCVCLNVLEHIADDRGALRRMASILRPGGAIVLLVPAFAALYGPIDRNLGHYRRYNRASLAGLAAASGLRVKKMHYMNAVGFFGWWANSRLFRRTAQSAAQIGIFDRCVVPSESWLEERVAPPFGQSIFAVLQKQ